MEVSTKNIATQLVYVPGVHVVYVEIDRTSRASFFRVRFSEQKVDVLSRPTQREGRRVQTFAFSFLVAFLE